MGDTTISWTDKTWNPTTGCDHVSRGCDNCYAERIATRFKQPFIGAVSLHHERLDAPLHWRKPRRVFVNSVSDLFHPDVPDGFIGSVWNVMALTPRHSYQILTKRPQRMAKLLQKWAADGWMWRRDDMVWCGPIPGPLPNVQLGVSVEDQTYADLRIPWLRRTPAALRFLSCEPLLGPIDLSRALADWTPEHDFQGGRPVGDGKVGWVIVGGESGPKARPMHPAWARTIRDQAVAADVPFHFKQWGTFGPAGTARGPDHHVTIDGRVFQPGARLGMDHMMQPAAMHRWGAHRAGRLLDGVLWDQFPD